MKNIHILPTDLPSRLYEFGGEYHLQIKSQENFRSHNIYITNSEEIKEGDWFITKTNDVLKVQKPERGYEPIGKKIILTTDQSLDGVQAIDDEFLEWFVKNPRCEKVEVEKIQYNPVFDEDDLSYDGMTAYYSYKIIIPKEEPKQETLEEAAEKYLDSHDMLDNNSYNGFIKGAKWQAERMYSELELFIDEVKDKIDSFEFSVNQQSYLSEYITEWFEQFKKK
jgi:hypothetical protein